MTIGLHSVRVFSAALLMLGTAASAQPAPSPSPTRLSGETAAGARWQALVPANWNGTLLVWSRGYSFRAGEPEPAPAEWQDALLGQGYALAGSNYGSAGWALAEAVPAQLATIAAFGDRHGKPRRTIAWGASMGGLVTTALAEQRAPRIAGGIAFCPSISGAVGMMNMGLDGAFALKTLVPEAAGLQLHAIQDDMANGKLAASAVAAALKTPQGRARLALAGVLGGIPGWTRRGKPQPDAADFEAQLDEIGASFAMGVVLPRNDQEKRAGGNFSWNTGVDYAGLLKRSGRRDFVEALYRKAGLELDTDLARLAQAPRVAADRGAVRYMLANYTPTARPQVPIVSMQMVGDGLTAPALQRGYTDAAPPRMASGLWLQEAGHCGMKVDQALIALRHLEARLDHGRWPARPAGTVAHQPQPMLRPCFRGRTCK